MRIWHEDLIPKLCRHHLLGVWREALGAYTILTHNKKGYRNHPALKEFEYNQVELKNRLVIIRREMLARGYNPKPIPDYPIEITTAAYVPWQTLEEQVQVLRSKNCDCKL